MTKITTIRDTLITLTASALANDYKRIPNPYSAEDNAQIILDKGYGISIGPAVRVDTDVCKMGMQRDFNIVLVRMAAATAHDITTRDAIEIALCEDVQAIRLVLERDNNTLSGNAIKTDFVGDSGIEFLLTSDERFKYYAISMTVSVLYQESIS